MKALLISGSRNRAGRTARAAQAILAGFEAAGGSSESIFLPELSIERCRQCDAGGWGTCRSEGHCCISDDMDMLVEKIRDADVVVFATPVYFGDLSESMRAFTDRLRRCSFRGEGGGGLGGRIAIGLCMAGGGGGGAPNCCVSLEKVIARCGFDVVDMIPVRRQNLEAKLEWLPQVGRWLATMPRSN